MSFKENEFIDYIKENFCLKGSAGDVFGIGDDCAVYKSDRKQVVTCDMLAEGTHFDLSFITGYDLGRKSALVNISDIVSMGASPKFALVSIGYSDQPKDFLSDIYRGLYDIFSADDIKIIGGDTVRSSNLVINVTMIGECREPVMRNGAGTGDVIIVSDFCGLSHAGLDCLLKYGKEAYRMYPELTEAHILPCVSVSMGLELAETGKIRSMMDLSDGISKDLNTLCQASSKGAEIYLDSFAISPYLEEFCRKENKNIYDYLLTCYEDYNLLMTCSDKDKNEVLSVLNKYGSPSVIGKITEEKEIKVYKGDRLYVMPFGWEHF